MCDFNTTKIGSKITQQNSVAATQLNHAACYKVRLQNYRGILHFKVIRQRYGNYTVLQSYASALIDFCRMLSRQNTEQKLDLIYCNIGSFSWQGWNVGAGCCFCFFKQGSTKSKCHLIWKSASPGGMSVTWDVSGMQTKRKKKTEGVKRVAASFLSYHDHFWRLQRDAFAASPAPQLPAETKDDTHRETHRNRKCEHERENPAGDHTLYFHATKK